MLVAMLSLSVIGSGILFFKVFIDGQFVGQPISITVPKAGIEVDKAVYNVGDPIKAHLTFCKNRDIASTWKWSMVDGILINFPPVTGGAERGCHNVWIEIGRIPPSIAKDEDIHLEGLGIYEINRFNTVLVHIKSESFKVK